MNLMKFKRSDEDIYINIDTISVIEPIVYFNEECTRIATYTDYSIVVDGNCKEIAERVSNFYRKRRQNEISNSRCS